mgnify:CR=1 FL=1
MDIVKDIKGNTVNVGDIIKFKYCDFENIDKTQYIISKINSIDYINKAVYVESGHICKYKDRNIIGGEKLNIDV